MKIVKKNSLKPAPGGKPFPMAGKGGSAMKKSPMAPFGISTSTPAPKAFKKGGMVGKGKC